jgi:hypothetical protein
MLKKPPQRVSLKSYDIIFANDFMCVTLLISRLLGINFIMHDVTILKFNAWGNKLLTTLLHEFQRRGPSLVAEQKQGITLAPTNMQKFRKWISRSKTTNLWILAPTPPSFNTTPLHLKMTNLSTQHNYAASNHHQACHQQSEHHDLQYYAQVSEVRSTEVG